MDEQAHTPNKVSADVVSNRLTAERTITGARMKVWEKVSGYGQPVGKDASKKINRNASTATLPQKRGSVFRSNLKNNQK